MRAISAPKVIYQTCEDLRSRGQSIGLVPTMGALHEGHLSLIKKCQEENDVTIVSIFVNPIQFNREEDLNAYPRTIEEDLSKLKTLSVDLVFNPPEEALYQQPPNTSISFGNMENVLEGEFRPGHFGGVGVIVSKLFHLMNPHRAYFGLKDLQQYLLIQRMVQDLSFQVQVVGVETKREPSGLAMSSRNQRLSDEGLDIASNIYKGLEQIKSGIQNKKELIVLRNEALAFYHSINGLEVEYLEIVDGKNLRSVESLDGVDELAICFAGYVEEIRLIDNLYLRLK